MKKSILVTGVSGAGKSTLSRKLNEMGYRAYNMDSEPGLFAMLNKYTKKPVVDHDNAVLEKVMAMEWICDIERLKSMVQNEANDLAFYCGAATNIEYVLPLFDKVILLKPSEEVARNRLSSRTDNSFAKTREVQDWVMSWKQEWEKKIEDSGAAIINSDKNLEEVVKEVIEKTK